MAESGDTTVVGADSHFKGELTFERTAKINGKFDGKITGKGELQVSQNAVCKADVEASGVQVDGLVEGNLNAKDTVKLNGSGVVRGDITAAKMVMSEGASFHGMCAVGPDAGRPATSSSGGPGGAGPSGGPTGQPGQPPKK
jgi:cytoskeletal protein CcmA (bactofilin family)